MYRLFLSLRHLYVTVFSLTKLEFTNATGNLQVASSKRAGYFNSSSVAPLPGGDCELPMQR